MLPMPSCVPTCIYKRPICREANWPTCCWVLWCSVGDSGGYTLSADCQACGNSYLVLQSAGVGMHHHFNINRHIRNMHGLFVKAGPNRRRAWRYAPGD